MKTKIVCLMGKSSTGKDTILGRLFSEQKLKMKKVVPYTTRPIRVNEKNGVDYFFVSEEEFQTLQKENKIIEERAYDTVHGIWRYFTVNDEQFQDTSMDICIVGTLEVYESLCRYFGKEVIVPVLIDLEDGERLTRALEREKKQVQPKFQELCRRFLADCQDFSEEKIQKAGIEKRFYNQDLDQCVEEILTFLASQGIGKEAAYGDKN